MPVIAPLRGLRPDARRVALAEFTWPCQDGAAAPPLHTLDAAAIRTRTAQADLVRDRAPAFYRYEVTWGPSQERRQATAVLCRLALEADATVETPDSRRADGYDVEPVVFRYEDPRGWVDEVLFSNAFDEVARFTDNHGTEHRLWRVERPEGVAEVTAQFEERILRLEVGARLLGDALAHWHHTGRSTDGAILALLAPEGLEGAPWRAGLVLSPLDEPRPRPWQELAGDPGKADWRTPSLG